MKLYSQVIAWTIVGPSATLYFHVLQKVAGCTAITTAK